MLVLTAVHALLLVRAAGDSRRSTGLAMVICVAGTGTPVATATQWENLLQGSQVALVNGSACISAALILLTSPAVTLAAAWRPLPPVYSWERPASRVACSDGRSASSRSPSTGPGSGPPRQWPGLAVGVLVSLAYVHGLTRPQGLPPPAPILSSLDALWRVTYGTLLALGLPLWYELLVFFPRETRRES